MALMTLRRPDRPSTALRYCMMRLSLTQVSLSSCSLNQRRSCQSSSSTVRTSSSHSLHLSHLFLQAREQLKAHPTTCQKSSTCAKTDLSFAKGDLSSLSSSSSSVEGVSALRLGVRLRDTERGLKVKAVAKFAFTGPAMLLTFRRNLSASSETRRSSSDFARVVN